MDSLRITSGRLNISRMRRTTGKDDSVIFCQQLIRLFIPSDVNACAEGDALLFHDCKLALNYALFQFHVGDSIHQQSAHAVRTLKHCNLMPSFVQQIRRCQSRGTAADYGNLFSRPDSGRFCRRISLRISIFNNRVLIFLRRYRISVQSAGAGILAERRTYPRRKFWKIVGLFQAVVCLLPVSCVNKVIPFRHQIVQRTAACHFADHHS